MSIVEPVNYWGIFGVIEIELNSFKGVHVMNVITVIERRLLVVKRGGEATMRVGIIANSPDLKMGGLLH